MNIKSTITKFDIGDKVYAVGIGLYGPWHVLRKGTIINIIISITKKTKTISYVIQDNSFTFEDFEESELFKTRKEAQNECNKRNSDR